MSVADTDSAEEFEDGGEETGTGSGDDGDYGALGDDGESGTVDDEDGTVDDEDGTVDDDDEEVDAIESSIGEVVDHIIEGTEAGGDGDGGAGTTRSERILSSWSAVFLHFTFTTSL